MPSRCQTHNLLPKRRERTDHCSWGLPIKENQVCVGVLVWVCVGVGVCRCVCGGGQGVVQRARRFLHKQSGTPGKLGGFLGD